MRAPKWDEARRAARAARPLPSESVDLVDADRRVLAGDMSALTALPAFTTSAMDGWAVSGDGPWRVVGRSLAGSAAAPAMTSGEAIGIATGARLPPGADRIVRRENGRLTDGILTAEAASSGDIRPAGEECEQDEILAVAGQELSPALIGLLAAAGHDSPLSVVRRPAAHLLILGDELLTSGVPRDGKVRDSLGTQLPAWLSRLGARPNGHTRVPDRLQDLVSALARVADINDVVVTTGGTAAGPVDFLHRAIEVLDGDLIVDQVAVRPGHPMLLARLPGRPGPASVSGDDGTDKWLLGLPGNPQSAIAGLMTLGQPLVDSLLGRGERDLEELRACEPISAPASETRLVAGNAKRDEFRPCRHLGSAMLRGLAAGTGFAVVPPGGVAAGGEVRWLPLPG